MLHNVLTISAATALAFVLSNLIGLARRKTHPDHEQWWQSEGIPVFIIVWFTIIGLVLCLGWVKTL